MKRTLAVALSVALFSGCASGPFEVGDSVMVTETSFHTEAPVVSFESEGAYNAHLERSHFAPDRILPSRPVEGCDIPQRYGVRKTTGLNKEIAERIAASGYDLELLRERVDQFVLHYDVCTCSRQCFKVLHDIRGLSVHFLLDLDGTVYQTLDLEHRARHATIANDRSIGVEIAQLGAYPNRATLDKHYKSMPNGEVVFVPPESEFLLQDSDYIARPARPDLVRGTINGIELVQYDFTEEQYQSLALLVRTVREIFPRIELKVPRDQYGQVLNRVLTPEEFASFRGILGHYHVQKNKSDPGPAFNWDRLLLLASGDDSGP